MYLIEWLEHGFTSIPISMYWAVVTMANVGFGDLVPQTTLGRFVTSVLILVGYSIIAVPTGIYTAELANSMRESDSARRGNRRCSSYELKSQELDALHCRRCGEALPGDTGH